MRRWARGILLIAGAAVVIASNASAAATPDKTAGPEQFVQQFYDWYSSFYDKYDVRRSAPPDVAAIRQRPALFDRTFAGMIVADAEAQSRCKGYADGLDYDPFLQVQDIGGHFRVIGVNPYAEGYRVSVSLNGKPHAVAYVAGHRGR